MAATRAPRKACIVVCGVQGEERKVSLCNQACLSCVPCKRFLRSAGNDEDAVKKG